MREAVAGCAQTLTVGAAACPLRAKIQAKTQDGLKETVLKTSSVQTKRHHLEVKWRWLHVRAAQAHEEHRTREMQCHA